MTLLLEKTKKVSKNYFTKDTEDAIVLYNNTLDPVIKSRIYHDRIHYPFFKLTQNIIHTFKFYNTEVEDLEHLQHEIIVFLLSKIHLFNPEKGTKAYSYFGTIVKRWCILYNNKNYNKKITKSSIEDVSQDVSYSYTLDDEAPESFYIFLEKYIDFINSNLHKIFSKDSDIRIADSLIEIFRKKDQITIFSKKAIYIYMREMIPDVKTPKISKVANTLQGIFKKNYSFYLDEGYINFQL